MSPRQQSDFRHGLGASIFVLALAQRMTRHGPRYDISAISRAIPLAQGTFDDFSFLSYNDHTSE